MLSKKEELSIRRMIYGEKIVVSAALAGPLAGKRALIVPDEIIGIHKNKRASVLRILLEIVKGGRPIDAKAAAALATALEDGPVAGVPIADAPVTSVDEVFEPTQQTFRDTLITELAKALKDAEDAEMKPGKTN